MNSEEIIVGTCMEMCPEDERNQREREGLLHRLEVMECWAGQQNTRKQADPLKTIKCFSRSAAGQVTTNAKYLRPGSVLIKTVHYIATNVVPLWEHRPLDIYEYVNDRFRAIRQDMTIQRLPPDECIPILEPMIRFYVLFGYLLGFHERFETHLNDKYANECLVTTLECYKFASDGCCVNKDNIETLYCCLKINHPEAVLDNINFENKSAVLELLVNWTKNNYWRCFGLIEKLDVLARAALSRHVPQFRARALRILCISMSSPNSSYQADRLALLLSYDSPSELIEDCTILGIRVADLKCNFRKADLKENVAVFPPRKWYLVDELLQKNFSEIVLNI